VIFTFVMLHIYTKIVVDNVHDIMIKKEWKSSYVASHTEQICGFKKFKGRIIKSNLSWSRIQAKFCHLIACLSVFISFSDHLQFSDRMKMYW